MLTRFGAHSFVSPSSVSSLTRDITHAELRSLPPNATFLRILGVNYAHFKTDDDGDLYITEYGLPFLDHLRPENWYESEWFQTRRERLQGSSAVYRVPTRPIAGQRIPSLDLVVKWSRVGEDVPLDTFALSRVMNAEFNSPFEEFSLVMELREGTHSQSRLRIHTQKPLAIYVPPERMQLWQTGRSRDRIMRKLARHVSVEIDILRSYILLYGWIKGHNAIEAYNHTLHGAPGQQKELELLTNKVQEDLREKGYIVADHKPTHLILRMHGHDVRKRRGQTVYALVDYELLARTPEHEEAVKAALRSRYLFLQRDRFHPVGQRVFPAHLHPAKVLRVDYIYGRAESTGGILWVVGNDPELFGYFLPERWRSKQIALSRSNRTFYAQTKDRIHLVWKVSRVGELPSGELDDPGYKRVLLHGYNDPFEEFDLALEMASKGVLTTYPRAIYVTAKSSEVPGGTVLDTRRFDRGRDLLSPEGEPILRVEPDYITIWGYWRGLDDNSAPDDVGYWTPIDARQAQHMGIVDRDQLARLIDRQRSILAEAGFEDVSLRPDHFLLSYRPGGSLKKTAGGEVETRHCNMEMVRRIATM